MNKPCDNPCGPGDLPWVVTYLTELLNISFDGLVAKHSVNSGAKNSLLGHEVCSCLLFAVCPLRIK